MDSKGITDSNGFLLALTDTLSLKEIVAREGG